MKKEGSITDKLNLYLNKLEKLEQFKTKDSRRKRIIKTGTEKNEKENKIQIFLNSWFFERSTKVDKRLS